MDGGTQHSSEIDDWELLASASSVNFSCCELATTSPVESLAPDSPCGNKTGATCSVGKGFASSVSSWTGVGDEFFGAKTAGRSTFIADGAGRLSDGDECLASNVGRLLLACCGIVEGDWGLAKLSSFFASQRGVCSRIIDEVLDSDFINEDKELSSVTADSR